MNVQFLSYNFCKNKQPNRAYWKCWIIDEGKTDFLQKSQILVDTLSPKHWKMLTQSRKGFLSISETITFSP